MEKKKFNNLELRFATNEVMIMSLYNSIKDIVKAIDNKAKIEEAEKWYEKCEETAIKLLESQKESDK